MKRLIFLFLVVLSPAGFVSGEVLINEFVYDSTGSDTGNEWIELYNTGSSTVSLKGWRIETDSNKFPGETKAELCGTVPPLGYFLIMESSRTVSTNTVADFSDVTLAMGNATAKSDGIQLLDQDGTVHDRVVYGGKDTDNLCQNNCTTAPAANNGDSLSRTSPGAPAFVTVPAGKVSPRSGGGACVEEKCPDGSGQIHGFISEVAPSIPYGDFIELFVTDPSNLCGVQLYEGETLIKTFPSVTPSYNPGGSYVLIHAGTKLSAGVSDETELSGDTNQDKVVDLFSDENSPGLSGSSNNTITLKNSDGSIADFLSWSVEDDGIFTPSEQASYDKAFLSRKWSPGCNSGDLGCYKSGSVGWSNRSAESISRKVRGDGSPLQSSPGTALDWVVGKQSPGKGYGNSFPANGSLLKIFQSPFSPFKDSRYSEAVISYTVPPESSVSITIYDFYGQTVRKLVEDERVSTQGTQTVAWDGKNSDGHVAELGMYIVEINAHTSGRNRQIERQIVVLGKKL